MSDEDKLLKARMLGESARNLMHDEAYAQAIESVKAEIIKLWTASKLPEERERAWLTLHLTGKISDVIIATYNNGKLANAELEEMISTQERKKRFGIL